MSAKRSRAGARPAPQGDPSVHLQSLRRWPSPEWVVRGRPTRPDWALILGRGRTVWTDVEWLVEELMGGEAWPGLVVAVNEIGVYWPGRLDHWVTMHPEKFDAVGPDGDGLWRQRRADLFGGEGPATTTAAVTWGTDRRPDLVDRVLEDADQWIGGSSGLLAVGVARALGCRRIVLAGLGITAEPHWTERWAAAADGERAGEEERAWEYADVHWPSWEEKAPELLGRVRSVSGRTAELLGRPTVDWLTTDDEAAGDAAAGGNES